MRRPRAITAALAAAFLTVAAPAAADDRLLQSDYAVLRAHPEDEARFSAFLAKLPSFEVEQGGVPRNYYVYEGDLLMTREEVRQAVFAPKQRKADGSVSPELVVNIVSGRRQFWPKGQRALTYTVDRASFPDADSYGTVVKAMGDAANAWIKDCPRCGLSLDHAAADDAAPREGHATFIVHYQPRTSPYIALAFFPGAPVEQRYIYVFPGYFHTNYDQTGVFRHELGHVLGYRHEQIRDGAGCWQSEGGDWQPLSSYDKLSVMHYFCKDRAALKLALSPIDIRTHAALYSGGTLPNVPIEHGDPGAPAAGLVTSPVPAPIPAPAPPLDATPVTQPQLRMSFIGGTVMKDLADLLGHLADKPSLLPTVTVTVAPGDTPASLLKGLGIPATDAGLDRLIARINGPVFDARKLTVGNTLVLPDMHVTTRKTLRTFTPGDVAQQGQKQAILKRWASKNAHPKDFDDRLDRVEFDAYDATIPYPTDEQASSALERLLAVTGGVGNVVIEADLAVPREVKAYTVPSDYEAVCRGPGLPSGGLPPPPPTVGYDELLDTDPDLAAKVGRLPVDAAKPVVYVVDTMVALNPGLVGADLDDGAAPAPAAPPATSVAWRCNWTNFVEALHHGTHMAGIIAARNGQGFIGLAPSSRVSSLLWMNPSNDNPPKLLPAPGREQNFADKANAPGSLLSVFLIASEFKPFSGALLDGERQLRNVDARPNGSLAHKAVFQARPLLIAAAGQDESGAANPVRITTASSHAPQDMGDLENVVVVTACEVCRHDKVVLQASAYYGVQPDPIVHLAAPGGLPIPGWVSSDGVSAAAGTSPAAAFVSGVVAAMIARYPRAYLNAEDVKRRLQMTAWPILPGANPSEDAWSKVATGVVDYQRAQLDPARSWLKDDSGWHAVGIKRWTGDVRFTDSDGNDQSFVTSRVLRILAVPTDDGSVNYALYSDSQTRTRRRGYVKRWGPLTLGNDATLELCDGTSVKVSGIQDLIVATLPSPDRTCS